MFIYRTVTPEGKATYTVVQPNPDAGSRVEIVLATFEEEAAQSFNLSDALENCFNKILSDEKILISTYKDRVYAEAIGQIVNAISGQIT